jgi:MFS family permease
VTLTNLTVASLSGVQLTYANGPLCNGNASSFNIDIYCDQGTLYDYNPIVNLTDLCAPTVQIVSNYGCSVMSVDRILTYLNKFKPYFGVFFILAGIVLCFFSIRLMQFTVCIGGMLTSIGLTVGIFYLFVFKATTKPNVILWWIAGGLLLGLIVGIVLMKFPKHGAALIAGWGGGVGGVLCNTAFVSYLGWTWTVYVSAVLGALITMLLTLKFYDIIIIEATSILGAYSIVIGISFYAGHYYEPLQVVQMIKAGLYSQIDKMYWFYVAGFFVFAITGILVQRKQYKIESARDAVRALAMPPNVSESLLNN